MLFPLPSADLRADYPHTMPVLAILLLLQAPGASHATLLHRIESELQPYAPVSAACVGDVDGDGVPDLVSTSRETFPSLDRLQLSSGSTGSPLWSLGGSGAGFEKLGAVLAFPDLDGDGVDDVLIGETSYSPAEIQLRSGADGHLLWRASGERFSDFGASLGLLADFNGDGIPEVLVGAPQASPSGLQKAGRVQVHSGADGARLRSWSGPQARWHFGTAVVGTGDRNADGVPDCLVDSVPAKGLSHPGEVRLISTADGSVLQTWSGGAPLDAFGQTLAELGDVDADGQADFAVGQPCADLAGLSDAGRVTCYSGATGASLYSFDGSQNSAGLGASLSALPDVDGDGAAELLAGAPGMDAGAIGDAGEVQLRSGRTGSLLLATAGDQVNEQLGAGLAPAADFDGDGRADFLAFGTGTADLRAIASRTGAEALRIEARWWTESLGAQCCALGDLDRDLVPDYAILSSRVSRDQSAIRIHSGADHRVLREIHLNPPGGIASLLSGGADFDQDGVPDLLYGNAALPPPPPWTSGSGQVQIYSGATGGLIRQLIPAQETDWLGRSLCLFEDLDADGIPEVGVGGDRVALIFSGGSGAELRRCQTTAGASYGVAVAAVEDLDGDGREDLAVSHPDLQPKGHTYRSGGVFFHSSRTGSILGVLAGPATAWSEFGASLVRVGDLNHDGVADLAVGNPRVDAGYGIDTGEIIAYSGRTLLELWRRPGLRGDHRLGEGLAALGDVDGDGVPDLASGSPNSQPPGSFDEYGRIDVLSGRDGRVLATLEGTEPDQQLGLAICGPGDLDGDGLGELLLGDPRKMVHGVERAGQAELWTWQSDRGPYLATEVLHAGRGAMLTVHGATGPKVSFCASLRGSGPTWIPGFRVWLDLSLPVDLLGVRRVDAQGRARLRGTVPMALAGHPLFLQAVDGTLTTVRTTNLVATVVR